MSGNGRAEMGKIMNQIMVWLDQTDFVAEEAGATDMDRVTEELSSNPDKYIDPAMADDFMEAASANYERIKEEFGLMGAGELDDLLADVPQQQRQFAEREIEDQIDEYGIEQVLLALDHHQEADPDLQQRVDDVLEEYPPDIYWPLLKNTVSNAFSIAGFPVEMIRREELEERREARERSAERAAQERFLREIRQELGVTGSDLDAVLEDIERRLEQGEAVQLETGGIFLSVTPDGTSIEVGPAVEAWRDAAAREARRELDLGAADSLIDPDSPNEFERRARVRIGTITTEDGQLADIDLTEGREELGEAPEATGEAGPPDEGEDVDEAEELADSLIDALEEGGA